MNVKILAALLLTLISTACLAQSSSTNPNYDAQLAQKLGADDYGMRQYVMVFLKAGPVKIKDSAERVNLQRAHLKNIIKLANDGKLIVAGPFTDDQPIEGIFIFNVPTVEEAKKLADTDPAVKAGTLIMELHPWYGSAALVQTVEIHKKLEKKSVADF